MKNLSLVGFMGSGKSTCAKRLSEILSMETFSTDQIIVSREKRAITEIFETDGEEYFRKIEKQVVKEISLMEGVIIDCGGGVILNPENVENLKNNGIVVYIHSDPEFIYDCIKGSTQRPILNVADPLLKIKELLNYRMPFYQKANYRVDGTKKSIESICDKIVEIYKNERK